MRLRVAQKRLVAEGIAAFVLETADGAPLPYAPPGSHIALTLRTPSGPLIRRYSLCGDPEDRSRYRIAVLREPQSRGGSAFVHEGLAPGDEVEAEGPHSEFPLDEGAAHTILIAGGIGITPLIPMLRRLVALGRSVELHYAARSGARIAFRDELDAVGGDAVRTYASDASESLALGELLQRPDAGSHVYTCGPKRLIDAVRERAAGLGWSQANVHDESFGAKQLAHDRPVRVELSLSGIAVDVDPSQTILEALLNAGVFAPYECERGECGSCAVSYSGGRPDHRDVCLTAPQREAVMCTCVSRAHSDTITIDL